MKLKIMKSKIEVGNICPRPSFFQELRDSTGKALACESLNEAQAWKLCEFIDCVDAGDIDATCQDYDSSVNAIGRFLQSVTPSVFKRFYKGSFTARGLGKPTSILDKKYG